MNSSNTRIQFWLPFLVCVFLIASFVYLALDMHFRFEKIMYDMRGVLADRKQILLDSNRLYKEILMETD